MENKEERNVTAASEEELEQVSGGKASPYLRYECRICGAVYRNDKELKVHLKVAHPNDPRAKW